VTTLDGRSFISPESSQVFDRQWSPVGPQGLLYERIVERLENLMAAKEIRPGDRLPSEREMARLLKVSRPSVREAVKTLEGRGRLRVLHGKGVFASQPGDPAGDLVVAMATRQIGLRQLFAMREVLEVPAAGWAAESASPYQLDSLVSSLEALNVASAAAAPDYLLLQTLDSTFHMKIAEAAGNRFMLRTLGVLQEMLAAGMQTTLTIPGRLIRSRRDHAAILNAILAGKASAARQAMRSHIRSAGAAALNRLASDTATAAIVRKSAIPPTSRTDGSVPGSLELLRARVEGIP
jgi:GntR family transcriptional regulator, transcriptional repressor for pyruvate dehydrogenase complex